MSGDPSSRDLNWTSGLIDRFWTRELAHPEHSFALQHGGNIVRRLGPYIPSGSRVLDYGCGAGYLANALSSLPIKMWAFDANLAVLDVANRNYFRSSNFVRPLSASDLSAMDGQFDCLIAVEMIEHLDDVELASFFDDARRLLSEGGRLLLTTPNSENLAHETVYCPTCDHQFHRWQHVRSVTSSFVEALAREYGFGVVRCVPDDFEQRRPIRRRQMAMWRSSRSLPHLWAVLERT